MAGNLIDLDDDDDGISSMNMTSVNGINRTNGLVGKMALTENRAASPKHDPFAGLASLMTSKKSFTPIPTPTPQAQSLSVASRVPCFASRITSSSQMLSPFAKPHDGPGSVAEFLREQQEPLTSALWSSNPIPEYVPGDMKLFKTMIETIAEYDKDEHSECDHHRGDPSPSPSYNEPLLISGLDQPARAGPTQPPTPAESAQASPSGFRSDLQEVVRVTKQAWEALIQELDMIKNEKKELENKLPVVEGNATALQELSDDLAAQLDLLQLQNDQGIEQKAAMGRALSEKVTMINKLRVVIKSKDAQIKTQKEKLDHQQRQIGAVEGKYRQANPNDKSFVLSVLNLVKIHAIVQLNKEVAALEGQAATTKHQLEVSRRTVERHEISITDLRQQLNDARQVAANPTVRVQYLTNTVTQRDKIITDLQQQLEAGKSKITQVEDGCQDLLARTNRIEDLEIEVLQLTNICDRQRHELRVAEAQRIHDMNRIQEISNYGVRLRGAAHAVAPAAKVELPKNVYACLECYGKALPCDNGNKCRNCTENNTVCKRFKCSLTEKLDVCPLVPCDLLHDCQGYLMLPRPRPEW